MALRLRESTNDYVEQTNVWDYNASYTVAWWCYVTQDTTNSFPFEISNNTSNRDTLRYDNLERFRLYSLVGGTAEIGVTGSTTVTDGWHHLAIVRNGNDLTFYLDFVSECTGSNASVAADRGLSAAQVAIGHSQSALTTNGEEDHYAMKIWTRALTLAEIKREAQTVMPCSVSSLWAVYPFIAGSTRANDYSGNGRNWTESGSPSDTDPPPVAWGPQGPIYTITAAGGTTVTPSTLSLSLATFAPTVTATDHQTVTPTTATLTLSPFAPTVTASDHQTVTPTTAALVTTAYEPTVTVGNNVEVVPTAATLALATFAPTVATSDNQTVTPQTAALVLTPYAPTIGATITVTPSTLALSLATFAPTVTTGGGSTVTPATRALVLTPYAPTVTATDQQSFVPTTTALTLATFAPTISTTSNLVVRVPVLELALTAYAPTVTGDPAATTTSVSELVVLQKDFDNVVGSPTGGYIKAEIVFDGNTISIYVPP